MISTLYKVYHKGEKHMKVQIIIGSTRPGRATPKIAQWVANESKNLGIDDVEIADPLIHQTLDQPVTCTTRRHTYTVKIEPVHSAPHCLISDVTIPPDRTVR